MDCDKHGKGVPALRGIFMKECAICFSESMEKELGQSTDEPKTMPYDGGKKFFPVPKEGSLSDVLGKVDNIEKEIREIRKLLKSAKNLMGNKGD